MCCFPDAAVLPRVFKLMSSLPNDLTPLTKQKIGPSMLNIMASALQKELPALLDDTNSGAKERVMTEVTDRTFMTALTTAVSEVIVETDTVQTGLNIATDKLMEGGQELIAEFQDSRLLSPNQKQVVGWVNNQTVAAQQHLVRRALDNTASVLSNAVLNGILGG